MRSVSTMTDNLPQRPSIETSAPGVTVFPRTGEAEWIGYAPNVSVSALDQAVEALRSSWDSSPESL